jgi:LmbE family N-acetylglucosaminyl deacetylase
MHTTDLAQLTGEYDHVYLSPHLDDAVLSCGGAIAAHCDAGARALVVTLCTAVPSADQFGPLAEEFRGDWSLSQEEAVSTRLREDLEAIERIGADSLWAGMLDSIYRLPFGYDTREKLFGTPDPADPLYEELRAFLQGLHERMPAAIFYAPLGVGYHVDHQITFSVARATIGHALAFYEDVYYVLEPGQLERRMAELADQGERMLPSMIDISHTLQRKIGAIDCYASQVPELFGGSQRMAQAITGYAERIGGDGGRYCERVWMFAPGDQVVV